MTNSRALWRSEDRRRWFLIPGDVERADGDFRICSATGGSAADVDRAWVARFEVSEEEGRASAEEALGETLAALKQGIDKTLAAARARLDAARHTPVAEDSATTRDAVPALFALLKTLPGVIGNSLSGQVERVETAKDASARLERRLREAGIDLGDHLAAFPDRLAGLRDNLSRARRDGGDRDSRA